MAAISALGRATMSQSASAIVADAVERSHVLKIDGYSRTKGLSNGKYISSATFDVGGHSWYIKYYPDGISSDNAGWISFFLQFQCHNPTDKAEAILRISLLDETGEPVPKCRSELTVRTFTALSSEWGCVRFIEKKALEESTYLKDDCFRVSFLGRALWSYEGVKETTMSHIQINDIEARVFSAMLHFIYTDDLPQEIEKSDDMSVSVMMSQHLLVVADRYDLERLKLMCEYTLCNRMKVNMVATTLALAEQHGCCGLKAACFEFLKSLKNLEAVMASDGFDHLMNSCPSLIKELLAKVAACP
ncbi:hypothetical protein PR202_gb13417 [Eleusine coracana subsp. coracana]|uniref:MATH domain-containing protein n=1 Tax=Eleusine coracana subsp. coracana TaxID=191504 RepID=A0AAV5EST9_ELECO|nr:hypothetical protein PR202_gb13417 [Eleusine coracana subsp. coracana]